MQKANPWGGDNRALYKLYANASNGECPIQIDTSTPTCGNSRFGCWTCTVVDRDKASEGLLASGDERMEKFIEFRETLLYYRDPTNGKRDMKRMNGNDGSGPPHVAEKAKQRIAEAGLLARCEVVGGDIFTSVPHVGDAYLLSRVINSFDDARGVAVLKACRQAMSETSKLLLVQQVLPDRTENSRMAQAVSLIDLQMMVTTGGCERTVAEHRALLAAAGFRLTKIVSTESEMSVVECAPA